MTVVTRLIHIEGGESFRYIMDKDLAIAAGFYTEPKPVPAATPAK